MQLAQAIEAWVEVHGRSLSASTRRDIASIAAAIEPSGYGEWATSDISAGDTGDIATEAATHCALSRPAIAEFLQVVIRWARTRASAEHTPAAAPTVEAADDVYEHEADDDDEYEDDDDDEYEDEEDDEYEDEEDEEDDEEDDEEEYEDDEDDEYEDEDDEDDEYEDDEEDTDDHPEVVISSGGPGALEPTLPGDQQAASSFLQTIESAPRPDFSTGPVIEPAPRPTPGGIFSAAAEQRGPEPKAGIDWITVAYFTVAAICFALVIYFYLSS